MTFAVTGANGFLGVHIIHHLLKYGHQVVAIVRPSASLQEFNLVKKKYGFKEDMYEKLHWEHCELYDSYGLLNIFSQVDFVMHTAGAISYHDKDFAHLIEINKSYTANVANMALIAEVKKMVHCSSTSALSKDKDSKYVVEQNEWDEKKKHSKYGLSKYLGECEVWRIQEEGLPTVIVNPGIILGFGNWNKGSNTLFKNAFNEFAFYSKGVTGFVGVDDVVRAMYKLCMSDKTGERYILVSENLSFEKVAKLMASKFDKKPPSIEVKGLLYKVVYCLVALKEFFRIGGLLSKETVHASQSKSWFLNNKIQQHLDFNFTPINDVIEDATNWYKKSSRQDESFEI